MNALRAMVVDDERDMRELLAKTLKKFGCSVISKVDNGRDAIKISGELHPDVVFMDVEMPGMNGLDALKKILAKERDVFVVMVSGHSSIETVKTAVNYGAKGFVVKPYNKNNIEQMLQRCRGQL